MHCQAAFSIVAPVFLYAPGFKCYKSTLKSTFAMTGQYVRLSPHNRGSSICGVKFALADFNLIFKKDFYGFTANGH